MRHKWYLVGFLILFCASSMVAIVGYDIMQSGVIRHISLFGYYYEYTSEYYAGRNVFMFGLMLAGTGLVGAIVLWAVELLESRKLRVPDIKTIELPAQTAVPPPRKYCIFCGEENKSEAVFCEKCGKQIS